jgi:hypothetical protein
LRLQLKLPAGRRVWKVVDSCIGHQNLGHALIVKDSIADKKAVVAHVVEQHYVVAGGAARLGPSLHRQL